MNDFNAATNNQFLNTQSNTMDNQPNHAGQANSHQPSEPLTKAGTISSYSLFEATDTDHQPQSEPLPDQNLAIIGAQDLNIAVPQQDGKSQGNLTAKITEDGIRHDKTVIANHQLLDKIAMERVFAPNRSLLKALFPGKEERLARDGRLQLVGSAIQQRAVIHRLYADYMAQGVKATLETRLMCMEAKQRAEAARVLSGDYKVLCVEVSNTLTGFIRLLNQKFIQLGTILSPTLRKVAEQDLILEERNTITFLRHLVTNFEQVAQRKINGLSI